MSTNLATMKGKEFALEALKKRREESAKSKQINNSMLPAGSPMYFYCRTCGALSDTLPESYTTPPKKQCDECQALIDLGWME